MEYRQLGRTDLQLSALGMGCVTFGREIDTDASYEILDYAHEKGITLFDTAAAYGQGASETVLGKWISDRGTRDRIVLATKVNGILTRDFILRSAEESLQRLNTEVIDLFQLHNWDEETPLDEQLEALQILIQSGKVRYCGCSNYEHDALSAALSAAEDNGGLARMNSIQPPYNLLQREIEESTLPLCHEKQIGVIAYSPLGAGFLTGKYGQGGEVPTGTRFDVIPGHQDIYFTDEGWRVVEGLRSVAARESRSMIQLALAWVLAQPGITSMLIGARSKSHVDQAFEAQASGLSDAMLRELSEL